MQEGRAELLLMRVRWSEKQGCWKARHPQREGEKETSGVRKMHKINLNTPDFIYKKLGATYRTELRTKKKKEINVTRSKNISHSCIVVCLK